MNVLTDAFAPIYELIYQGKFSSVMFSNDLYVLPGILLFIIPLLTLSIYYYLINHPRFNKFIHWLLFLFVGSFILSCICYFYTLSEIEIFYVHKKPSQNQPFDVEFVVFAIQNFVYSVLLGAIYSFFLRLGSKNCSMTPYKF